MVHDLRNDVRNLFDSNCRIYFTQNFENGKKRNEIMVDDCIFSRYNEIKKNVVRNQFLSVLCCETEWIYRVSFRKMGITKGMCM